VRTTLVACVAVAALGSAASQAAAPRLDAHDRALARALAAKVNTFKEIAKQTGQSDSLQKSLDQCALVKKDPSQAFGVFFALIPALLAELVNDYGPQIRDIHETLLGMQPHSALFRKWTAAEGHDLALMLKFDNHGKKIDLCEAATVMLDKKSTPADVRRVIGIDPSLIALLFTSPVSKTLTSLNPRMQAFFVAAGLSKADAKTLTS
jgi:hypothetical protein